MQLNGMRLSHLSGLHCINYKMDTYSMACCSNLAITNRCVKYFVILFIILYAPVPLFDVVQRLDKRIKQLQESELTLDDMDSVDTNYVLEERYVVTGPAWAGVLPFPVFPPLSIHFLIFCSFYFSPFSHSIYLFSFFCLSLLFLPV